MLNVLLMLCARLGALPRERWGRACCVLGAVTPPSVKSQCPDVASLQHRSDAANCGDPSSFSSLFGVSSSASERCGVRHFISDHKDLCADVFAQGKVKNDAVNENYPFAPTSINITGARWGIAQGTYRTVSSRLSSRHLSSVLSPVHRSRIGQLPVDRLR